jgi:hypothetical protein
MISAPTTGTATTSSPSWLPAGETRVVLQRWKKEEIGEQADPAQQHERDDRTDGADADGRE